MIVCSPLTAKSCHTGTYWILFSLFLVSALLGWRMDGVFRGSVFVLFVFFCSIGTNSLSPHVRRKAKLQAATKTVTAIRHYQSFVRVSDSIRMTINTVAKFRKIYPYDAVNLKFLYRIFIVKEIFTSGWTLVPYPTQLHCLACFLSFGRDCVKTSWEIQ